MRTNWYATSTPLIPDQTSEQIYITADYAQCLRFKDEDLALCLLPRRVERAEVRIGFYQLYDLDTQAIGLRPGVNQVSDTVPQKIRGIQDHQTAPM